MKNQEALDQEHAWNGLMNALEHPLKNVVQQRIDLREVWGRVFEQLLTQGQTNKLDGSEARHNHQSSTQKLSRIINEWLSPECDRFSAGRHKIRIENLEFDLCVMTQDHAVLVPSVHSARVSEGLTRLITFEGALFSMMVTYCEQEQQWKVKKIEQDPTCLTVDEPLEERLERWHKEDQKRLRIQQWIQTAIPQNQRGRSMAFQALRIQHYNTKTNDIEGQNWAVSGSDWLSSDQTGALVWEAHQSSPVSAVRYRAISSSDYKTQVWPMLSKVKEGVEVFDNPIALFQKKHNTITEHDPSPIPITPLLWAQAIACDRLDAVNRLEGEEWIKHNARMENALRKDGMFLIKDDQGVHCVMNKTPWSQKIMDQCQHFVQRQELHESLQQHQETEKPTGQTQQQRRVKL